MTAVFVDSFALIAWLNPRDQYHSAVEQYFRDYTGKYVTTEWILVEFADGFSAPNLRHLAVDTIRRIRVNPLFEVIPYDPVVYQAGFDLFASRPDKAWSLTDCISFAVMESRGLTDTLTADRHFAQAGFKAIFADPPPN